ncbi:ABC transporter ATP-binding protein [Naumannella halotolerans]|uniref:Simple sugar transport system ATP-binding protein n=1 Tax=Naumannella halotolerans TaxID=993414 RepID=A0A4R7J8E8_9ACTN|nr:ATP-binding cassette domain-containing protein [Naumannella halotolerans]TDT33575.1 simple sugar transport system ATP-binding protein [Naumannella halotolerans]
MTPAAPAVIASGKNLTKRYGSVTALDSVDIELHAGEIHALIGENGAGKSTLTKILAGLEWPTTGMLSLGGKPANQISRQTAIELGIGLVQQHFTLIPTYTAEENLALSRPTGALRESRSALVGRLTKLTERYQLPVRPRIAAHQLSVGERQRLEILRALDSEAQVLLLDEPTAVLVDAESVRLMKLCRELAEEGRAIMIVTHRLSEVMSTADRLTVLRQGRVVLQSDTPGRYTKSQLAKAMIGDAADSQIDRAHHRPRVDEKPAVLSVESVTHGRLTDCSFDLHPGEIVGIAGVDGNGQAELETLLCRLATPDEGQVTWHERRFRAGHPRDRPLAGIAYIPSDRHQRALASPLSLADNLELGRGRPWRAAKRQRLAQWAEPLETWDVRGGTPRTPAGRLSGGNAQKVVLAREMAADPDVVVAAYPTRGLDPGAATLIAQRILSAVADRHACAVWFGSELDELLAVADRIIVLVTGQRSVEFHPPFDRDLLGEAMAGMVGETESATPPPPGSADRMAPDREA